MAECRLARGVVLVESHLGEPWAGCEAQDPRAQPGSATPGGLPSRCKPILEGPPPPWPPKSLRRPDEHQPRRGCPALQGCAHGRGHSCTQRKRHPLAVAPSTQLPGKGLEGDTGVDFVSIISQSGCGGHRFGSGLPAPVHQSP